MSNTGLGLREALDFESEELPRTHSRRAAAQAQAQARALAHERGANPASRATRPGRGHEVAGAGDSTFARGVSRGYGSARARVDANGVRTVKIRGQVTPPRRRPLVDASRPIARYDQHPDRVAQWALFLGVFMVVVAIVTGS